MSKSLTVSYDLKPPAGTAVPESHPASGLHQYPMSATTSQQAYYKALREAVLRAKAEIGADLTIWRDAVGTLENAKEPKVGQKEGEEEDAEDSDEQA